MNHHEQRYDGHLYTKLKLKTWREQVAPESRAISSSLGILLGLGGDLLGAKVLNRGLEVDVEEGG